MEYAPLFCPSVSEANSSAGTCSPNKNGAPLLPLSLRKLYSGLFVVSLQALTLAAHAATVPYQLATLQQNPASLSLRDDISDTVINKAVYRKGKGGCVKVFAKLEENPLLFL